MRLTKIYTRRGDGGTTSLATGESVGKDDLRIEAYGTIDELNAFLGLWKDELADIKDKSLAGFLDQLTIIQHEMHDLGGELSMPGFEPDPKKMHIVGPKEIGRLEEDIDQMNQSLEPLKNFVLAGGHRANSLAHVCRTICRRAERRLISLAGQEAVREDALKYINRLSDWLFVASRFVSHKLGVEEVLWNQRRES